MGVVREIKKFMYRNNPHFKRFFKEVNLSKPENVVFCSFDLETTGLDFKNDEIISIGAVKIIDFKVDFSTTFYTLVKPGRNLDKENVLIHGIREEELQNAPSIKEVLPDFLDYIRGTVLLGYFVTFDIAMISKYTKKFFGFEILNPYIDLQQLYQLSLRKRYLTSRISEEKSLDEMAKELGIEVEKRHDAMCDCLISAFVFLYFVKTGINWKKAVNI
ncbi:3'-5' exonuclease [Desulfurobacterium crinifex]